jgi:hypothetical protein
LGIFFKPGIFGSRWYPMRRSYFNKFISLLLFVILITSLFVVAEYFLSRTLMLSQILNPLSGTTIRYFYLRSYNRPVAEKFFNIFYYYFRTRTPVQGGSESGFSGSDSLRRSSKTTTSTSYGADGSRITQTTTSYGSPSQQRASRN